MGRETTETLHWDRLLLALGIGVGAYAFLLQPVAAAFLQMDHQSQVVIQDEKKLLALQKKNETLAALIQKKAKLLGQEAQVVKNLSSQLVALQKKERSLSATIAATPATVVKLPTVTTVPTVQTTTGASSLP